MHAKSVSRFHHLNSFFLSFLFPREEISTLSRQASFRRVNSVSTDPRGTVLWLNYSLHAQHTAASLSYVFSRVCTTWFRLSELMTPPIRISRLLVPYVSHLFKNSYRNILWWILHTVARSCSSLRLISCLTHWLTYFDFSRKQTSGFGSFERACSRLHGEVWASVLMSTLCFLSSQTEENIPLRVEGTLRTSLSSLGVSLWVYLTLHAGPGTDALLSRCQTAKFWASAIQFRHV